MARKIILFEKSKLLGGYALAVRDPWSYHLKRVHVREAEKVAYEKKFGQVILLESEFLQWWSAFNNLKSY